MMHRKTVTRDRRSWLTWLACDVSYFQDALSECGVDLVDVPQRVDLVDGARDAVHLVRCVSQLGRNLRRLAHEMYFAST